MRQTLPANRTKFILTIILAALFNACFFQANAQTKTAISFGVEKTGTGKPIILIPGLECSGKVWDETVQHYKKNHTCYAITLPGFAGQPAIVTDSFLVTVVNQLAAFITENKLVKPVIVGHSLGGSLALQLGITYPALTGDIVCVSSAPFLPGLAMGPNITVDSSSKIGLMIKAGMQNQTPAQVRASQQYALGTMMRDSNKIASVIEMAVKSDPKTQGQAMYELFSSDLRASMNKIQSRILVLTDWVAYKQYGATHESVLTNYKNQFSLAKQVRIEMSDTAKHFIMFDEPAWFFEQVDSFLK